MNDPDKAERKKRKKIKRLLKKSAGAMGVGIGLLILKFLIVPFLGDNENAEKAITIFGWSLLAYGSTIIISFMFLKNYLFKINIILSWGVMPLVFIKLLMDAF